MKQMPHTFLIVDDKRNMLSLMAKVLRNEGIVYTADNGAEALRILASEPVEAILCDLQMPDMDGLSVLKASKRLRPEAEFVLMTAYATVGTAVEALKLGAYDYLTKPFKPDDARAVLLRAAARVKYADKAVLSDDKMVLPATSARGPNADKSFSVNSWDAAL